jgi:hypothetical protein
MRVIRASGSAGLTQSAFETRFFGPRAVELAELVRARRRDPAGPGELAQHRLPARAVRAPHDRAHRRVRLHGRGVDPDAPALDQPAFRQQPEHQREHGVVDLERQARAGARQRAVIGHRLARAELQELAQGQAVGAAPGDAALAVQALEVADEQHPEVAPGRN